MTPRELADRNVAALPARWSSALELLERRLHPHHRAAPPPLLRRRSGSGWQANGDIYLDNYAGWYSVRDEAYYAEDETDVGEDDVRRGPQGTPVEWIEEESYFFRLSAYQDKLLALYEAQPDFIVPPTSGATRSSASSRAACRTCRSRAPRSTGASRCPAIPST